jgi:acyl carrier protein
MTTTYERLTRILVEQYKIDPERLSPEEPLAALGLDSLGMVELLFMIEDEFAVKLPHDIEPFPTLASAVQYLDATLARQPAQVNAGAPRPQQPQQPQPPA